MFKFIQLFMVLLLWALFWTLNPHPVAVSIFPGNVYLVSLNTMITISVFFGLIVSGIFFIPKLALQRIRIKRLRKNLAEMQQEFMDSINEDQDVNELEPFPAEAGREEECGMKINFKEVENVASER